jgi:DNA segregation ATPase FtsK/SpoIIIE and related proteins
MKKLFSYHGKRIKAKDKNLITTMIVFTITLLFFLVTLLFYGKMLLEVDLDTVQLSDIRQLNIPYLIGSLSTAFFVCLVLLILYFKYRIDSFKQLEHRQKLAQMVLQNKWYEAENIQNEGFFKDLPSKSKEKITHFPKMYYRMENGLIHIKVEIVMSKYQDQLLQLEKKLEAGLYCELVDKELQDSFIVYTLLYDTIASRIQIDEVQANNGRLKLMKNLHWEYDKLPHMLIAGGTGGGKTYFILTIIEALLPTSANIYILDPKNADLADLEIVMPNQVFYRKEDMIDCIHAFYTAMLQRSEEMKKMPNYKTGENYAYVGLEANFLIFDEYIAFMDMLGRESADVISKLKQIVMLGRQAGFFLILACQRPDAKYLGDGIRDQFNFRVALGRMSELGYGMMFGSDVDKQFFLKPIKGRGYVDVGTSVISEFYTPLVPKGYDFLERIENLVLEKNKENETDTKEESI